MMIDYQPSEEPRASGTGTPLVDSWKHAKQPNNAAKVIYLSRSGKA